MTRTEQRAEVVRYMMGVVDDMIHCGEYPDWCEEIPDDVWESELNEIFDILKELAYKLER